MKKYTVILTSLLLVLFISQGFSLDEPHPVTIKKGDQGNNQLELQELN